MAPIAKKLTPIGLNPYWYPDWSIIWPNPSKWGTVWIKSSLVPQFEYYRPWSIYNWPHLVKLLIGNNNWGNALTQTRDWGQDGRDQGFLVVSVYRTQKRWQWLCLQYKRIAQCDDSTEYNWHGPWIEIPIDGRWTTIGPTKFDRIVHEHQYCTVQTHGNTLTMFVVLNLAGNNWFFTFY